MLPLSSAAGRLVAVALNPAPRGQCAEQRSPPSPGRERGALPLAPQPTPPTPCTASEVPTGEGNGMVIVRLKSLFGVGISVREVPQTNVLVAFVT